MSSTSSIRSSSMPVSSVQEGAVRRHFRNSRQQTSVERGTGHPLGCGAYGLGSGARFLASRDSLWATTSHETSGFAANLGGRTISER
jgi:hypothetical protein